MRYLRRHPSLSVIPRSATPKDDLGPSADRADLPTVPGPVRFGPWQCLRQPGRSCQYSTSRARSVMQPHRPTDIQMMIRRGTLTPGTPLIGDVDGTDITAHIQPDGQLRLATGDVFRKADDAARAVTGKRAEGMLFWQVTSSDGSRKTLRQLRDRGKPKPAKSRRLQRPIQRRALRRRPEATIGPSEGLAQRARRRRPRQPKRPELPGSDGRSLLRPSEEQGLVRGSRVLTAGVKLARRARVNAGSAAGRGYGVSPEGRAGRFVHLLAHIYA